MKNKQKGFSFIEGMVVLSIIAILVALILPVILHIRNGGNQSDKFEEVSSEVHNYTRITVVRDRATGKKYIISGSGAHSTMTPYQE